MWFCAILLVRYNEFFLRNLDVLFVAFINIWLTFQSLEFRLIFFIIRFWPCSGFAISLYYELIIQRLDKNNLAISVPKRMKNG